jgi:arylsulfatase A-like enzyme
MKRTTPRRITAVVCAGFVSLLTLNACEEAPPAPPDTRPNVLLILVDDLNTDVGCLDGGGITPNIDQLAREGVLFTNTHANSPVCNPSRTSFLTGMLPPNTGVRNNKTFFRDVPGNENVVTLPQHFRDNGYQTVGAGKVFHASWKKDTGNRTTKLTDRELSWDNYARFYAGTPGPTTPNDNWHNGEVTTQWGRTFRWGKVDTPDEECGDFQNAQFTANFLSKPQDKPFFLACGILRPHLPLFAPSKYFEQYPLEDIDWPPGYKPDDTDDLPYYGKHISQMTGLNDVIRRQERWKQAIQAYRASTSFADAAVGVVLDALKKSPHRDNTIVILVSDHGFHLGEKNHWTKFTFWDRSTRVPMIVAGPGIAPGASPRTISLVDLYPTLNELCGLPQLDRHDGQSFAHLITDPQADHSNIARVFNSRHNHEAIIDEDFRYIRYIDGGEELYDRKADPHDWHNLAEDPAHATTIERYRQQLFYEPLPENEVESE